MATSIVLVPGNIDQGISNEKCCTVKNIFPYIRDIAEIVTVLAMPFMVLGAPYGLYLVFQNFDAMEIFKGYLILTGVCFISVFLATVYTEGSIAPFLPHTVRHCPGLTRKYPDWMHE